MKWCSYVFVLLLVLTSFSLPARATVVEITDEPSLSLQVANENLNEFTQDLYPGETRATSLELSNNTVLPAVLFVKASARQTEKASLLEYSTIEVTYKGVVVFSGSFSSFLTEGTLALEALEPQEKARLVCTISVKPSAGNSCTLDYNPISWQLRAQEEEVLQEPVLEKENQTQESQEQVGPTLPQTGSTVFLAMAGLFSLAVIAEGAMVLERKEHEENK